MSPSFRIVRTTRDDSALASLVQLLDAELCSRNGEVMQADYSQFNSLASVDAAVVAYSGEQPVGCGCFRQIDAATAEIKRMFVRSEHRGTGAAAMILDELERWMVERGHRRAILETGLKQVEAIGFYTKAGYLQTENYGQYMGLENSVCFAKPLRNGKIDSVAAEP